MTIGVTDRFERHRERQLHSDWLQKINYCLFQLVAIHLGNRSSYPHNAPRRYSITFIRLQKVPCQMVLNCLYSFRASKE